MSNLSTIRRSAVVCAACVAMFMVGHAVSEPVRLKGAASQQIFSAGQGTASVDRVVYVQDAATVANFMEFFETSYLPSLKKKNPEIKYEPDPRKVSASIKLSNAKSVAISGHPYWESIEIDVTIASVPSEDPWPMSLAARSGALKCPDNGRHSNKPSLIDEFMRPEREVEIKYVVDGRYAAGGKPAKFEDYHDMETDGYREDLESFITTLNARYENWRSSRKRAYNGITGCAVSADSQKPSW